MARDLTRETGSQTAAALLKSRSPAASGAGLDARGRVQGIASGTDGQWLGFRSTIVRCWKLRPVLVAARLGRTSRRALAASSVACRSCAYISSSGKNGIAQEVHEVALPVVSRHGASDRPHQRDRSIDLLLRPDIGRVEVASHGIFAGLRYQSFEVAR
jgi:hypothetical protein